jgi:hypothetical protein
MQISKYKDKFRSINSIIDRADKNVLDHRYGIEFAEMVNLKYFVIKDVTPLTYIFGDFVKDNIYATAKAEQITIVTPNNIK